ncbi:MAG: glycosyltransferase family 2 protein [Candidatus Limiplasma sp.]|nr:glycosyltransferase family 2 protein [Candidatus Limiplasma sp.]
MLPLISMMVTIYNMESCLHRCVDSLLRQDYPNVEIILLNDGSTDSSREICEAYVATNVKVRSITQLNAGLSACRNSCVENARGEYLAFVDADDWVEPAYLSTLYGLCEKYQTRLAACNHSIIADQVTSRRFPDSERERTLSLHEIYHGLLYHGVPDVSAWGKLYHRSLFNSLRYPVGRIYEDTYLIAELVAAAGALAYTPWPLYHYWLRPDSISRDTFQPSKMDFMWAVNHLVDVIISRFPELQKGAIRRQTHAALSVRRYFVDCDKVMCATRDQLENTVRGNAFAVLMDRDTRWRDKIAILAVLLGPWAYDTFWKAYSKKRKQY